MRNNKNHEASDAKAAVRDGMSLRGAARKYIVPYSTLRRRVQAPRSSGVRSVGRPPKYISPAVNDVILETVHLRARCGMCLSRSELRYIVHDAAKTTGADVPDSFPNNKWILRFIRRNPTISLRKAQILSFARQKAAAEDNVREYIMRLATVLTKYDPGDVYNCDETGVCAQGRTPTRVICPKGMRANVLRSEDRENVSIMACCSAAGVALPPMYIFAGQRRKLEWGQGAVDGATVAMTDSLMIQGPLFLQWFKWFVDQLDGMPSLLILDGHFSHLGTAILLYARENNVEIFALPAHCSHFCSPVTWARSRSLRPRSRRRFKLSHCTTAAHSQFGTTLCDSLVCRGCARLELSPLSRAFVRPPSTR